MQVSNGARLSSAIIGKTESVDFMIDDSPEFFEILSKSIYTYPEWAVVRETLCNAHDAHIEAGKVDIPVIVTIDEVNEETIIRDKGKGIPHDMKLIQQIYCTYGKGTKRDNGEVTGGFGLGCKAPLGLVDTFQVTSFHEGKASVYMITKASNTGVGKPQAHKVAEYVTDESGVEVRIPLDLEFSYFKTIANLGAIPMELNGDLVETLEYSNGCALVKDNVVKLPYVNSCIAVKYGAAVYPFPDIKSLTSTLEDLIEAKDEDFPVTKQELDAFTKLMGITTYLSNAGFTLIIEAPENSLHLQPSRENVSMSPLTAITMMNLVLDYVEVFFKVDKDTEDKYVEAVTKYISENSKDTLYMYQGSYVNEAFFYPTRNDEQFRTKVWMHINMNAELKCRIIRGVFGIQSGGKLDKYSHLVNRMLYLNRKQYYANAASLILLAMMRKEYSDVVKHTDIDVTKFNVVRQTSVEPLRSLFNTTHHSTAPYVFTLFNKSKNITLYTSVKYFREEYRVGTLGYKVDNKVSDIENMTKVFKSLGFSVDLCRPEPKKTVKRDTSRDIYRVYINSNGDLDYHLEEDNTSLIECYVHAYDYYEEVRHIKGDAAVWWSRNVGKHVGVYVNKQITQRKVIRDSLSIRDYTRIKVADYWNSNIKEINKLLGSTLYKDIPNLIPSNMDPWLLLDFLIDNSKSFGVTHLRDSQLGRRWIIHRNGLPNWVWHGVKTEPVVTKKLGKLLNCTGYPELQAYRQIKDIADTEIKQAFRTHLIKSFKKRMKHESN